MAHREPVRTAARRTRSIILAASVVAGAAIIGVAASPVDIPHGGPGPPVVVGIGSGQPTTDEPGGHDDHNRPSRRTHPLNPPAIPLGEADGAVPDGVTVFDDNIPAVAKLDPDLLGALRRAATDAADDEVEFVVNSGWRSREYQEHLLREAVSKYGSEKAAARWVATPDTSPHVSGDAVDIGPSEAAAWLSQHGAEYGLCQIYRNEPWHYERRPEAVDDGCPSMYANPTRDPRMQQ